MRKLSLMTAVFLLLAVLVCSLMLPVHAAKLSDAEYADLFKRASGPSVEGITAELENAFIADPLGFVKALAMENYSTMYFTILHGMGDADWSNDPNRAEHRQALLTVAGAGDLSQSQRRVVKWLLTYTDISTDYEIFIAEIDYPELFSHMLRADGMISTNIEAEIMTAFDKGGITFLRALALESSQVCGRVTEALARTHYFENNNRGKIGDTMKFLEECDGLSKAEQQMIADFWAQIDAWETPPPTQPPTMPTIPPTVPTTIKLSASISLATRFYAKGEEVKFNLSCDGETSTLQIRFPDGTTQTFHPAAGQSVISMQFTEPGNYQATLTTQTGISSATSGDVYFLITDATASTPQPQKDTPQPSGSYALWVIAGIIVVALGAQVVMLVRNKKKD
jgi:hypothetical protein